MQSGTFLIAEIGQAHEGSLGLAHSYIDALVPTGVDAIKFQTHIAEAESSEFEPFRIQFSYLDETRPEYWKRMEFTYEEWQGIKRHCEEKNLEFISTPSSKSAVDLLDNLGVEKFKIGSGDTNNLLLLEHVANTGKDIILSSGMSSIKELDESISFLKSRQNTISLLQCTSSYPTDEKQWGLNVMQEYKKRYDIPIGFSDHSGDVFACLAAASLKAEILEFHAVFDNRMFGPDSKSSLNIEQIKTLVTGVRQIETALKNPVNKTENASFREIKNIFEKSLSVNKELPEGHHISLSDLECKKPKNRGIPANQYAEIIGKQLNKSLSQWTFITVNDFH